MFFFFFSSRRRHTRFSRDWSSDVCSSDLAIGASDSTGMSVSFTPVLAKAHLNREFVVAQGTGLDLAAPLKFKHAANLPFAARGTGISFTPATAFAHSSNEPVQPLGA